MAERTFSDAIDIARPPADVYALVSDVTRMGGWSPICKECWWADDATGPAVGAVFVGRNETPERTWETRSRVAVADPGREFAFTVGDGWVRWGYRMEPIGDDGAHTRLTESWHFTPAGIAGFAERYGDDAAAQIENRTQAAHTGIPQTLSAIKLTAESG